MKKGKPNYFCSHCNIPGHSIERCFKIHGFPPGFSRDRKVAANVSGNLDGGDGNDQHNEEQNQNQLVTVEQYNHLMNLLGHNQSNAAEGTGAKHVLMASTYAEQNNNESHTGMLTGTMCLFSHSNHDWIVDSEATDHICPNISLFSHYEPVTGNDNYITIPNGSRIPVLHKGSVRLNGDITLTNVLKSLIFNLITSLYFKQTKINKIN